MTTKKSNYCEITFLIEFFFFLSYVHCACNVIKLILKMFAPVIRENMQSSGSHGVDISREERYVKMV